MNRYIAGLVCLAIAVTAFYFSDSVSFAQTERMRASAVLVSPHLVISQFQAGGASVNDEFIEILNTSSAPVDLNGYRIVYRSQNGVNDVNFYAWTTSTTLLPGQYYLIASTSYTGSATPNATYNNTTCSCALAAADGGLAIRQGSPNTGAVIDAVGWGSGTNIFFEGSRTTAPGNNNSKARKENGCQDTDNNSADFETLVPSAPRNSSSAPVPCSGSGETLFAAMNANPTTVSPGGTTLLTVTVIPATSPPSTNITVAGSLAAIGGSENQVFYGDGTNGDITPGDNVFSYLATVPANASGGPRLVVAVAVDAQARTVVMQQVLTINAPLPNDDPLLLGNPSNATPDVANENNYLMHKPQYSLSYNRSRATANWVAWRLDGSWIGGASRQDDYRPDPDLPAGWYRVEDTDYSGSGYDRGHMCPSGDRTRSIADNSATFLMTNMVPQYGPNNQGPWERFESYSRELAAAGNEIYIYSGVHGQLGTIANGNIVVPQYTWKVILVIPNGDDDLRRINKGTRALGIIVPNFGPIASNAPWRSFRVTVKEVELLTGYDFFTNIGKNTQELIERRRDRE